MLQQTPNLTAVVAMAPDGLIGRDGDLPWRLSSDLRRFKRLTMGGVLIMGRRTFESIPEDKRPLPGRQSVVITRQPDWNCPGVQTAESPEQAIELAGSQPTYVVGGAEIYREMLPACERLWLTRVWSSAGGDTFLSIDLDQFEVIEHTRVPAGRRDSLPSEFLRMIRKNS